MEKTLFICLLSLSFLFSSCSKEVVAEEEPEVSEYPKTFSFNKTQKIEDFTCYVGSASGGKKLLTSLISPKEIWKNRLNVNPNKIILLDQSKLEERNDFSSLSFTYKVNHDSLFILNGADMWVFAAKLKSDKLIYHLGFERYTQKEGFAWSSGIGQSVQLSNYQNMFGGIFESPAEMVNEKDTIAWCNVYYEYNKEKEGIQ